MNRLSLYPGLFVIAILCSTAFAQLDVTHYKGEISFEPAAKTLTGKVELSIRNAGDQPLTTITLHLRDLTVSKVEQRGQSVPFNQGNGELTITLAQAIPGSDSTIVEIEYGGSATNEGGSFAWGGCFWGETSFVLGVGFSAPYVSMMRHWIPSNDIPSDKATFDLTYSVPEPLVAAGTGLLTEMKSRNGRNEFRWVEQHPTATYLVTYAIRNYAMIDRMWNGIPLQYFVAKNDSTKAVNYFATVPQMLEAFTGRYGAYPFDKVGYCITSIGAMEHQTMISYPQSLLSSQSQAGSTAAHELAHQWWGNWVTPKDFREAWLSEGFATFSEAVYAEHLQGKEAYFQTVRQFVSNYRGQVEPSEGLFPLFDFPRTPPSSNYPQTIYQKGASVLAMLRHVVGDTAFFAGLKTYGQRFAFGNATTGDFAKAMEDNHGESLAWFFDQWVYRKGYPNYTVQRLIVSDSDPFRLRLLQLQDTTQIPLFHMPLDYAIILTSGDTVRGIIDTKALPSQEFSFPSIPSGSVATYLIDPLGVVLKRMTYRTVGVDPTPLPDSEGMRLDSVFPHPVSVMHDEAVVPFFLSQSQRVRLEVVDFFGRSVLSLANGTYGQGLHHAKIEALPAGVYAVRIFGEHDVLTRVFIVQ